MANSHSNAFFWSHAGQHFEIRDEGEWWAAVPDADWPASRQQLDVVLEDFGFSLAPGAHQAAGGGAPGEGGDSGSRVDDGVGYGDRRQEIVFIGAGMDRAAIEAQLDGALLTAAEMGQYRERYRGQPDPPHAAVLARAQELAAQRPAAAPAALR